MGVIEEFRQAGVTVVFVNQPAVADDAQSRLLLGIQGLFAEYERAVITERLRRAASTVFGRDNWSTRRSSRIPLHSGGSAQGRALRLTRSKPQWPGRFLSGTRRK